MALAIRPKPGAGTLKLFASPAMSDGKWRPEVADFHQWALAKFGNAVTLSYQMAEALDVHRVIAVEWIAGLVYTERAVQLRLRAGSADDPEICAFQLIGKASRVVNVEVGDELTEYDPWVDREFDMEVASAVYPDFYIDKYFDVFTNEYYAVHKRARRRPDGSTFMPLKTSEHPRYAQNPSKTVRANEAPPLEWRRFIDEDCRV